MTLLKWQESSIRAHVHRMMYDSGSCSCARDGWGDTMRRNCLTQAPSIDAVIVALFPRKEKKERKQKKNPHVSLFFLRE